MELWEGQDEEESSTLMLKVLIFAGLPQMVALPEWLQAAANSLQCLILSDCGNFESFPDWFPVLSDLKTLSILDCPKLVSLPDNFNLLTALESLKIEGCADLYKKYEPHVGEFWPQISHIQNIFIKNVHEEGQNFAENLDEEEENSTEILDEGEDNSIER